MQNTSREENPFEDEKIAAEWINSVENEKGLIRDKEIYPHLEKWIELVNPKTVIEIGSGQGICSEKINNQGIHYIGIEPSPLLTERARKLYASNTREFILGDAYELPIKDVSTDAVFSVNVWFHLRDLLSASKELARVLKLNGHFLIITANPDLDSFWENCFISYTKNGKVLDGKVKVPINPLSRNIIYQHTLDEICEALEKNGLIIEKIDTFGKLEVGDIFIYIQGKKP